MTTSIKTSRKMIMILAITTGGFLLTAIFTAPLLSINAIMQKYYRKDIGKQWIFFK